MRSRIFFLFILLGITACQSPSSSGDKCGGCRLRYCDQQPGDCDCGCFDGDVVNGATCKDGCFVRPPDLGSIDCSRVGCAPPPLCSSGCTAACGCCACAEETVEGGLRCTGGCYAPVDMK